MYCKECGFQLSSDAKFCPHCGTKVEVNGIGNIEKNAVWGTICPDNIENDKSSNYINDKAKWDQTIYPETNKKNIADNKDKKNSIIEQHEETYIKQNIQGQGETISVKTSLKPRTKIIKRKQIGNSNIFVAYWGYSDDNRKYPNQWYEDSNHNKLSDVYYKVSSTIQNNTVIVKQNGKYAFARINDNKFERVTNFVFEQYSIEEVLPEKTRYYVMYSSNEEAYCYDGHDLYKITIQEIKESRPKDVFGTGFLIFFFSLIISTFIAWILGTLYLCLFEGLTWSEAQNSNSTGLLWVWPISFIIIFIVGIKIFIAPEIIGYYYNKGEKVTSSYFIK